MKDILYLTAAYVWFFFLMFVIASIQGQSIYPSDWTERVTENLVTTLFIVTGIYAIIVIMLIMRRIEYAFQKKINQETNNP